MSWLARDKRQSFFLLSAVTVLVILGMLYFGVRLKGFRSENNVQWSDMGNGLAFSRSALAHTDGFFTPAVDNVKGRLTIELAIEPQFFQYKYFKFLLSVHSGEDAHQLVIGQWRSSLVIMNGNDYSNRLRTPKIYLQLDKSAKTPQLVTLVSNNLGTRIFIDGALKKHNKRLFLRYPIKTAQSKLVVGNGVSGNNPWDGTFFGVALYDDDLGDAVVQNHYQVWRAGHDFNRFASESPRLLYAFDEGKGEVVHNLMGDELDLMVPNRMKALETRVLSWPAAADLLRIGLLKDYFVNLIGFMPLGFFLFATLCRLEVVGGRASWVITVLFAFCFSLLIESAQAWIPSRDSSMLDLILNNMGSWSGIVLFNMVKTKVGVFGCS